MNLTKVSTSQARIAEIAKRTKQKQIFSLNHFINMEWLKEAWRRTRKDAAVGVDNQTALEYSDSLEDNLKGLLGRLKSGSYNAPKVKRHYIPKADGSQRPIGIPTIEDKVAQRAITMILEEVYEQEFYDYSYGFRPGRSCHQALERLRNEMMDNKAYFILDIDIQKCFDSFDHSRLREFLDRRVKDGVIRRLIDKWLKAEILDRGCSIKPISGTMQGGVLSPLLANVFLHYVIDEWFDKDVKPRLKGHGFLVRYCDDMVLGFQCEEDARRVYDVLPKRLARFGLKMHPEKSRTLDFRPPPRNTNPQHDSERGARETQTFNFLGFTHIWHKSRKGNWVVSRRTMKERLRRGLKAVAVWCKRNRHKPLKDQSKRLGQFLRGHYNYFGLTGNFRQLGQFHYRVVRVWRKWLSRRSRENGLTWEKFLPLMAAHPLPKPRIKNPYCQPSANL